jgi:AraC-like DNA-binding protein
MANFWVPIQVQNVCLGMICFQARRRAGRRGGRPAGVPVISESEFDRAGRLLRLIAHDAVETALVELGRDELNRVQRQVGEREKAEARLREELHQVLPAVRARRARLSTEPHGEQVVREVMEYVHQNYGQPVRLKECAEKMCRNAASLSALFSRTVGLPFKRYLTELRLQKAEDLLSDPRQTIAEVAYSVGYTDPNRFRLAFKQWSGLPPSEWRGSAPARRPGDSLT